MIDWTYSGCNGPEEWPKCYPQAAGNQQSPIDIQPVNVKQLSNSRKLKWRYTPEETRVLLNTGRTWKIECSGKDSELTGGPLGDNIYLLKQLHCHWGDTDDKGSEHTVGGQSYGGELHFVHWNKTKYCTFEEATKHGDGLAVIGVFLKAGVAHEEIDKVVKSLPQVTYQGDKITMASPLNPSAIIPENSGYWTYMGSLTTPPCNECVVWIVFKDPVQVSPKQLEAMRSMHSYPKEVQTGALKSNEQYLIKNYRPTLPLGQREVQEAGPGC